LAGELGIRMPSEAVLLLLKDEAQAVKATNSMRDGTIKGSFEPFGRVPAGILEDLQALPIHFQPRLIP
jgi:hypothetical protein